MPASNPFQVQGTVEPPFFTDRAAEIARVREALLSPPAKLLLYGDRRMGKTSLLHMARREAERRGTAVLMADFSTASTVTDLSNRLLAGAARGLGRSWSGIVGELVSRLRISARLVPDPASGVAVPTLDAELRDRDIEEQRATLQGVLDSLESLAAEKGHLGIVLDEFQEIHRFGGESAEWHLRGIVQEHRHVSYVLAGSRTALIRRMLEKGRAFYELFDVLHLGPIDSEHLARWIDERLEEGGRPCPGVGVECIGVAGPRTRDVVQLARTCWELMTSSERPTDAAHVVEAAFRQAVVAADDPLRAFWNGLTPYQQNVLRAVAGSDEGLTTRSTLRRFALGHSGSASNAAAALIDADRLVRVEGGTGYDFDSPFLRGWVVINALPDAGIHIPATWRAAGR